MKRVRVVVPTVYWPECPTIRSRLLPLCRELTAKGFDFTFYVLGEGRETVAPGIEYRGYAGYGELVMLLLRLTQREADIILPCKPYTITGLLSWVVARTRGLGYLLDVDDLTFPSKIIKWWRLPLYCQEWLSERFLMFAKVPTVVASAGLADYWGKHAVYIPNSVDPDVFSRKSCKGAGIKDRFALEGSVVIWPAVFFQETDRRYILEIFSEIERAGRIVSLLVVGDGEYLPSLREASGRLGLKNIVFAGKVDHEEMPTLYAAVDAGLLPLRNNHYDACKGPIKLFEYMSMELPVIATDIGEPATVLRKADCGILLPFGDPERAAELIVELLADREGLRRLGVNGRKYLVQRQHHGLLAGLLERKLEEVLHHPEGRTH